mgnify:CR=1 FL=1
MNDWLMAFQADIIDTPVRRPPIIETTALGAAGLAGLSAGVWASPEDFAGAQGEGALFVPSMGVEDRGRLVRGWERAVRVAFRRALQANPEAHVELVDGDRDVMVRPATEEEQRRLWQRWTEVNRKLDEFAVRRTNGTTVVILEPAGAGA